ncbi:MAG: hypothetical protein ACNA77_09700 [Opitutales bacterium]
MPPPSQGGFVLVAALGMMSFVLLLILSLTLQAQVELRNVSNSKARILARENARLGLMIALGNLQRHAGPDQRVTARAEIEATTTSGTDKWSGIWDAMSGDPDAMTWLVSGQEATPALGVVDDKPATLAPASSRSAAVKVDWISIGTTTAGSTGRYAYWVQEEGVKARVNLDDNIGRMPYLPDMEALQNTREQILQFPSHTKLFPELSVDSETELVLEADVLEKLIRAQTIEQVGLAFPDGVDASDLLVERQHDFTIASASVLEDSIRGGLKANLTGRNKEALDDIIQRPGNENDFYLKGDYHLYHNLDPQTGLPFSKNAIPESVASDDGSISAEGELVRVPTQDFYSFREGVIDLANGQMQVVRNIMPIVSEMSFRLGAFHTQSDAKHRLRFHVDVEFWNPYPFPIRMPVESQDRCFIAMMVPSEMGKDASEREKLILSLERTVGSGPHASIDWELHTNLFDFDEQLGSVLGGGNTNNTLDETVLSSWMVIDDVVLLPGEVYHATTQRTVGLARDLGGYIIRSGGDRENADDYIVDPDHDYKKLSWETVQKPSHPVLSADDDIRVSLRMPENGVTMRLIAFDAASQNSANSPLFEDNGDDWAKPVFELRNIYKVSNPPPLSLRGDEYSRATSGSYTLNNYNIGFHFRLADELILGLQPNAADLALRFDLRQPVWDYDNPAVQELIDIAEENPFAVSQLGNIFDGTDVIADGQADSHSGAYEQVFLYRRPSGEPLSVGSFHQLPLSYGSVDYDLYRDGTDELVQIIPGMPWGGEVNEVFDKYFYTGAPASNWTTDQALPLHTQIRSGIAPERMREENAAADLLIKGGFNVNSLSGPAWAAMLSRTIHDWRYDSSEAIDLKNAFLNFGQSTDDAIKEYGSLVEDSTITDFDTNDSVAAGRLAMRYPLRRLTDQQIYRPATEVDDSLVEFILKGLREYFADNPPFPSVAAFVKSGILETAIRESEINGSVARFSPAYISQATILEPLAPYLTVRSDTFVIRSLGAQVNPTTGEFENKIICEAIVQRLPDRVDGDTTRINEAATSNGNTFGRRFAIQSITWKQDN